MACAVPLMFQSKYSDRIAGVDLALILAHVKYRMYTHFTILALLHIEDWELTAVAEPVDSSTANPHSF